MPTSRPFAYNTGSTLSNTAQYGNIAVLTGTTLPSGVQWWMGPDEDLGYVITAQNTSGNQPNPLSISAYIGFYRTSSFSDSEFLGLANYVTGQNLSTANAAKDYLFANGYWTSYSGSTSDVTPNPVDWPDVFSYAPEYPTTINQTITGINVPINLFWSCNYCGDGGTTDKIEYSINDGSWTPISENTNFSVSNNDTLKFRLAVISFTGIVLDIKNNSDNNTLLDTTSLASDVP